MTRTPNTSSVTKQTAALTKQTDTTENAARTTSDSPALAAKNTDQSSPGGIRRALSMLMPYLWRYRGRVASSNVSVAFHCELVAAAVWWRGALAIENSLHARNSGNSALRDERGLKIYELTSQDLQASCHHINLIRTQ